MAAPHSKHKRTRDSRPIQRQMRVNSTRVQLALRKANDEEAALNKRIELEQAEAAEVAARRAVERAEADKRAAAQARLAKAEAKRKLEEERAAKREYWSLGQARSMYRQGYTLEHCIERTGWDAKDFEGALEVQRILDES